MGESIETSPPQVQKTLEESFNDACPYFMAIGMSYDEFWYKDPTLCKTYLKAHEIRQKQENERMWLQGLYTYIAICDASPILHDFVKKGTKPLPYLQKPISMSQEENENRIVEERNKRLINLKEQLLAKARR